MRFCRDRCTPKLAHQYHQYQCLQARCFPLQSLLVWPSMIFPILMCPLGKINFPLLTWVVNKFGLSPVTNGKEKLSVDEQCGLVEVKTGYKTCTMFSVKHEMNSPLKKLTLNNKKTPNICDHFEIKLKSILRR